MKHCNSRRASQIGRLAKTMMIGSAAAAFLGFSMNAQAQPACTVDNWTANPGLSDDDAGYQGANNRRYGGPCGLRVPFDGETRLVMFESEQGEVDYIARFYAFLDDIDTADPVIIFAGEGDGDDQVQVWYNFPAANDLTLRARDQAGTDHDLTFESVGSGWHSIEFEWHQDASAEISFIVNSDDQEDELSMTIDTSGLVIQSAHLGNAAEANTGGFADFDDFDSRRSTRPGRLLRGDATDSGNHTGADSDAVLLERLGLEFAPGQPDCTESGSVTGADSDCVLLIRLGLEDP